MIHYTSIEQNKTLLDLELNPDTADMHYLKIFRDNDVKYIPELLLDDNECDIPCWSLGALLELIPNYQLQTQDKNVGLLFGCRKKLKIIEASTPIEAAFQMVVWLLKNNYIKNEKQ